MCKSQSLQLHKKGPVQTLTINCSRAGTWKCGMFRSGIQHCASHRAKLFQYMYVSIYARCHAEGFTYANGFKIAKNFNQNHQNTALKWSFKSKCVEWLQKVAEVRFKGLEEDQSIGMRSEPWRPQEVDDSWGSSWFWVRRAPWQHKLYTKSLSSRYRCVSVHSHHPLSVALTSVSKSHNQNH